MTDAALQLPISALSPNLRLCILLEVVDQLHNGHFDQLCQAGLSPRQLDQVRTINLQDVGQLVRQTDFRASFQIDADSLSKSLAQLRMTHQQRGIEEYFVLHGASQTMLRRHFTMSNHRLRELRVLLSVSSQPGRPAIPDDARKSEIQNCWERLAYITDLRDRMVALHSQFPQFNLATLDAVIHHQHAPSAPISPASKKKGDK